MQGVVSLVLAVFALSSVNAQESRKWRPASYEVTLNLADMQSSDTFNGDVRINMAVEEETSNIILDVDKEMNVSDVKVTSKSWNEEWTPENIKDIKKENSTLTINFVQTLDKDNRNITMNFTSRYQSSMGGLTKLDIGGSSLAVASLEPKFAHKLFPCFDHPHFRANITMDLIVQNNETVIMSTPPSETTNISDSLIRLHFANIPPMAVHQLGFVVMNEKNIETRNQNVTTKDQVNVFTRALYPFGNQTEWATEVTAQVVGALVDFTGQPFPFPNLEQVVLPEVSSNLYQSWGLISYSEEDFLVLSNLTSTRDKQEVALLLAERVAAQYFGGVITTDWKDSWLILGFSHYLKYIVCDSKAEMSYWELQEQMIVDMIQPALAFNISGQALALAELDEKAQIQAAYSDLNKYKGAAVLRMVHHIMGDKLFKEVIRTFINNNKNKVIEPSTLWELLYKAARGNRVDLAGKSMLQVMESWVNNPGQPTLSVTRNLTHFIISQGNGSWYVRVWYALESNPHEVQEIWLLPGNNVTVSASGNEWILVNMNQTSFCRVNYSSQVWSKLSRTLQTDMSKIPRMMRAQLLSDAFGLWMEGSLITDTLLDTLECLRNEKDYFVMKSALRNSVSVWKRINSFPAHSLLQNHMLNLLEKVISDVGMESTPKDTHIDKLKRSMILENACLFGHPECQKKASSILASWINQTKYDPDLNTALLCAGVANSSADVWQAVHSMYVTSTVPSLRSHLLAALTCSRDPLLIKQLIVNVTLMSTYTQKEKNIVLKELASNPVGSRTLFNWLLNSLNSKLNKTMNETEENATEQPTTEPSATEGLENNTNKGARDLSDEPDTVQLEKLSDEDIILILSYLAPTLTHLDNGTKLEAFAKNDSGMLEVASLRIIEALKKTIIQIYQQDEWARNRNGEIKIWLENAQKPTTPTKAPPSDTTVSPPATKGGAATLIANASLFLLTLVVLLRHLS